MSPRAFTEAERERIQDRLLRSAAEHFARFGYRKANISEITRDVGIAKGSLYHFVASKAELFIQVVLKLEQEMRDRLLQEMEQPYPSARARLRRFLGFQYEALAEQPLLKIMVNPEEAAALMRDLPAEMMEDLRRSDEAFYAGLAEKWQAEGLLDAVDPQVLAALPRVLFAITLQREMIGSEVFPVVIDFVIESLSASLTPGENMDTPG